MKEIRLYQCDICGIQYSSRMAVANCEAAHVLPKKIIGHKYHKEAKYADYIIVEFEDGSTGKYKRS